MYSGHGSYLQVAAQQLEDRQLRRPYFWTTRRCSRMSALYRSIWPASLDQLWAIFLRISASAALCAVRIKRRHSADWSWQCFTLSITRSRLQALVSKTHDRYVYSRVTPASLCCSETTLGSMAIAIFRPLAVPSAVPKLGTRSAPGRFLATLAGSFGVAVVSWSRRFDEPIVLEDGTTLQTLRQAIQYLAKTVPKAEQNHEKVLIAADHLTRSAEQNYPDVLCPRCDAAGDQSVPRARDQSRSQRPPLGQAPLKPDQLQPTFTMAGTFHRMSF